MSIRDLHRSDVATHSLLGGQYGEESEESEEGQEEGQQVVLLLNDAIDSDVESSVAKAGEAEGSQRNAAASGHAGSSRRRRASAKPRFILHGFWIFKSGFIGRSELSSD